LDRALEVRLVRRLTARGVGLECAWDGAKGLAMSVPGQDTRVKNLDKQMTEGGQLHGSPPCRTVPTQQPRRATGVHEPGSRWSLVAGSGGGRALPLGRCRANAGRQPEESREPRGLIGYAFRRVVRPRGDQRTSTEAGREVVEHAFGTGPVSRGVLGRRPPTGVEGRAQTAEPACLRFWISMRASLELETMKFLPLRIPRTLFKGSAGWFFA